MSFMIESRKRNSKDEWEPVSLTLHPRKYHFSSKFEAEHALIDFLTKEDNLSFLIARLATGENKINKQLEFRIVEVLET